VRDATEFGPSCPQAWEGRTFGSEDCLYLNVWSPAEIGDERRPVMFWIHSGGFTNGATDERHLDGSGFVEQGMVFVSTAYRLGRFGFFAHPALTAEDADDGRLGNYGIMDQIVALEWVRENITSFGGDPENVTIFGMSAGGDSVDHLMTAPLARGLFHRAISESGFGRLDCPVVPSLPLSAPRGLMASGESVGLRFAARHGIEGEELEALQALRELPASDVLGDLNMLTRFSQPDAANPMADGVVLPAHFEEVYAAGEESPVPLIVGANDADGFYPFTGKTREQVLAQFGELRAEAEAQYDPAGNTSLDRIGTLASADVLFLEPARHIARMHAKNGHPTYAYRFSYVLDAHRENQVGAKHSQEVPFIFGTIEELFGVTPSENDRRVSQQIRDYWIAFARTGVPAPEGLPKWPRYDQESDVLIDFRFEGPVVGPDPARERLDLAEAVAESRREAKQGK
jgi:para-nitrobenzyl esterase